MCDIKLEKFTGRLSFLYAGKVRRDVCYEYVNQQLYLEVLNNSSRLFYSVFI